MGRGGKEGRGARLTRKGMSIEARVVTWLLTNLLTYLLTWLLGWLVTYLLTYLLGWLVSYLLTYLLTWLVGWLLTYLLTYLVGWLVGCHSFNLYFLIHEINFIVLSLESHSERLC